jgi:superfamily II DNA or RNA helicase
MDREGYVGRVWLDAAAKRWVIQCEPDVMLRLKRIFERIPKEAMGRAPLADSPLNAKELLWFMMGYRLRIGAADKLYLKRRAREEVLRQRALTRVLSGDYQPSGFRVAITPWDFQYLPAELCLAAGGVLCADEVGLGKTLEGALLLSDPRARPGLVVCPTHLVAHWQDKLAEYLPGIRTHALRKGTPYPLTQGPRGREMPFPDVILCTYAKLAGWAETLAGLVKTVVYDEVHNLCHEWAVPYERLVKKYAAALHLRDHVPYRLGLSGTPIKNYGGEVRVVVNVLLPDALGTDEEFGRDHCGGARGEKARVRDPDALGALMIRRGLMVSRTRKEVGRVLPPVQKFIQPVELDMKPLEQVKLSVADLARQLLRRGVDPDVKRRAALEIDWRLRHATGVAKAPYVCEFVKILAGRSPVVLFGWHKDFYTIVRRELTDFRPVFFTGDETPPQKKRSVDAFLAGDSQVFVCSHRSGEGIDGLQKVCSTVVVGELDWSWSQILQNIGRLHREGQTQNVFVHFMIADAGADPPMADAIGVKRQQLEGIRHPHQHVIEPVQTDPNHVKELARSWLRANDPRALAEIEAEIRAAEEQKATEKAARAARRMQGGGARA